MISSDMRGDPTSFGSCYWSFALWPVLYDLLANTLLALHPAVSYASHPRSMAFPPSIDPMPEPFRFFFCYVEPGLTFAGASMALFRPRAYHTDLLPFAKEHWTPAAVAAIRNLGNCYLLLGCMSAFFLPLLLRSKRDPLETHDLLLRFLAVLAFADITHIVGSHIDLAGVPFASYNVLAHGNTTLVYGLFAWRTAWYLTTTRARRRYERALAKRA